METLLGYRKLHNIFKKKVLFVKKGITEMTGKGVKIAEEDTEIEAVMKTAEIGLNSMFFKCKAIVA